MPRLMCEKQGMIRSGSCQARVGISSEIAAYRCMIMLCYHQRLEIQDGRQIFIAITAQPGLPNYLY
jgi:hypothetical protein